MYILAYNSASKVCATGDRGWARPCSQLCYLGSVGKSIHPGNPQHSPSTCHALAAPQICPPSEPSRVPLYLQCSTRAMSGVVWAQGRPTSRSSKPNNRTQCCFGLGVTITAGCTIVWACEPRQALSRAVGRSGSRLMPAACPERRLTQTQAPQCNWKGCWCVNKRSHFLGEWKHTVRWSYLGLVRR